MCTAVFWNGFLARTVDRQGSCKEHRILIKEDYMGGVILTHSDPIWVDGLNKRGLSVALLNYEKDLSYDRAADPGHAHRLHPGQLIPYLLKRCGSVAEASPLLREIALSADAPEMYPHFLLADTAGDCAVYEGGRLLVHPLGVLANAPSLDAQMSLLPDLTARDALISWDHSSPSRFQRLAWLKHHAAPPASVADCLSLLATVTVPAGMDPRPGYRTLLRVVLCPKKGLYAYSTDCGQNLRTLSLGRAGLYSPDEEKTELDLTVS